MTTRTNGNGGTQGKGGCPACGGKRKKATRWTQVWECKRCGAIYGTCYLGESYEIVLPYFHQGASQPELERHYDLTCLGSKGIERRHGWYNTRTRRITQVG